MPALLRDMGPRGPKFWRDDGRLMFVNRFDPSTRDGPREATDDDMDAHPEALLAFQTEDAETPNRPVVTFLDPPDGRPAPEEGPHAKRRREAREEA